MRRRGYQLALATAFLVALWAGGLSAVAAVDSAVVLVYQRVGEANRHPLESVTLAQFEAHLAHLKQHRFAVIPLRDIIAALATGRPLPERAVAITFDNAFSSAYRDAWPRLKAAEFPFSVFVATDAVDTHDQDVMSWDELRALAASGVGIESRGASNRPLWRLDAAGQRADIERGRARIEAELGAAPRLFAYPSGEHSEALRERVRALGFVAAFGLRSGPVHPGEDSFALPRFELNQPFGDLSRFAVIVTALPLPIRDLIPREALLADRQTQGVAFTVDPAAGPLGALGCYATRQGRVDHEVSADRRVTVRLTQPFEPGHDNRINCTLPAGESRVRWLGLQYLVP